MKILILGATGFVGSTLTRLLVEEEYQLVCAGRDIDLIKQRFPTAESLYCDFLKDQTVESWLPRFEGIDIIVNCIGIFYHQNKTHLWNIHFHAPKAVYQAAVLSKVKQVIHLSALGIEGYRNDYADSKKALEDFLKSLTIPHLIIKPSVIYGAHSKGSMEVLKKLAASPILIPLPAKGEQLFQPIYVGDLAKAMKNLILRPPQSLSLTLAAVPSQQITLKEMLLTLRKWLGFKKGYFLTIPFFFIQMMGWLGEKLSLPTLNKSAINMLQEGNYTSAEQAKFFQDLTQVQPLEFLPGLNQNPAVQEDRWHARLLLLRPFLQISLAIMWLFSSLTSVLPYAKSPSYGLFTQIGITTSLQPLLLYGAAGLNALIGLGLLVNYKVKINCVLQLLVILFYSLIISLYLPYLWLEPFGPIVKNIPVIISVLTLYILES